MDSYDHLIMEKYHKGLGITKSTLLHGDYRTHPALLKNDVGEVVEDDDYEVDIVDMIILHYFP